MLCACQTIDVVMIILVEGECTPEMRRRRVGSLIGRGQRQALAETGRIRKHRVTMTLKVELHSAASWDLKSPTVAMARLMIVPRTGFLLLALARENNNGSSKACTRLPILGPSQPFPELRIEWLLPYSGATLAATSRDDRGLVLALPLRP